MNNMKKEKEKEKDEEKKKVGKINRLKLWFLFGFAWGIPQLIILYVPQNLQIIKSIILVIVGFLFYKKEKLLEWFLE